MFRLKFKKRGLPLITFLFLLASCGESENHLSASQITEPGSSGQNVAAAHRVILKKTISDSRWRLVFENFSLVGNEVVYNNGGERLKTGDSWLVLALTVKNLGEVDNQLNPAAFKIKNLQGKEYSNLENEAVYRSFAELRGGKALTTALKPGQEFQTFLLFEIPENSRGLTLIYKGEKTESINLSL